MGTYFLSHRAESDIDQIVDYISEDKPQAAIAVAKAIRSTCSTIGDMPGVGRSDETIGAGGILYFPVAKYPNYLVFYVIEAMRVIIVRVLHAKRDIPELLKRWYGKDVNES